MTIGLLIRKANVTPSGMPASTKPMNSGTAEHEQNGVTTPKPAAPTVAGERAATGERGPHPLGREVRPRGSVTAVTMPSSRSSTFGTS